MFHTFFSSLISVCPNIFSGNKIYPPENEQKKTFENVVIHESISDVNPMPPEGKKRRMGWDSLDLNVGVDSKMANVVSNGKDNERSRSKNVNGGKLYL